MNREQFEDICEHVELVVNETWDDVQYVSGGDAKESVEGQFYTTFVYMHNHKRYDVHINNVAISVYKNGLMDNSRIFKVQISENWQQKLKDFLKTI